MRLCFAMWLKRSESVRPVTVCFMAPAHMCTVCKAMGMQEVQRRHARWLRENQHIRYMWIPYTDTVVVVANNQLPEVHTPTRPRSCSQRHISN